MPKLVDHEERRRELGHAVWRVIRRDGIDHVSVRSVASEAGWSPGALRHYFTTQGSMLAFAMRLVVDRIDARIAALEPTSDPRLTVEQLLFELLPLDAERRAENEIWLAFVARAMVTPELRVQQHEVDDALREACHKALETLGGGAVDPVEVERLHALIDGLATHTALRPEHMPPERIVAVVRHHLDALAASRERTTR